MKRNLAIALPGITLFAALAISAPLIAQEQSGLQSTQNHHTHYKVVFIGTFGGAKQPLFYRRNAHSEQ